jgi:hypothetical protein
MNFVELPERIASVLAPHLGAMTADSVARHLCAKHEISDGEIEPAQSELLRETLRRGLVAFVGAEAARSLADECLGAKAGQA